MRSVSRTLLVAVIAVALAPWLSAATAESAKPGEKEPFKRLTVDQVQKKLKDPAVHVYDGNREDVYRDGHVPGAVLLYSKDIKEGVLPPPKDTPLIFYCHNEL